MNNIQIFSLFLQKKSLNQMLRVVNLSRAQPAARNLMLVTKRYQQSSSSGSGSTASTKTTLGSATAASTKSTPGSNTTQFATNNPSSATKPQTASTTPLSNTPIDRSNNPTTTTTTTTSSSSSSPPSGSRVVPPSSRTVPPSSSSSYPAGSTGGSGGTVKAIVYGVAIGLGVTLLYAEYDNGSFRRKVESTLPLSSTILGGLDKVIDPVFGRHKKLTTIISDKLPDVSAVTNRLPDKEQLRKAGEQVKDAGNTVYNKLPSQKQIEKAGEQAKDAINDAYDKLPEYKKVKGAITHAGDQVKDAVNTVRDALPDSKDIKKSLTHAKEQAEDTAKSVSDTVKGALPGKKGVSGDPPRRSIDPVFLEEPGEVAVPPPVKRK